MGIKNYCHNISYFLGALCPLKNMPLRLSLTMWGSCTCYEFDSRICRICVSYFRMLLWRHVMTYFHSKPHWNWYWSNKKTTEILYQSDILSHNGTLMGWLGDAQIFHLQCSNIFGAEQIFVWCRILSRFPALALCCPRSILIELRGFDMVFDGGSDKGHWNYAQIYSTLPAFRTKVSIKFELVYIQ